MDKLRKEAREALVQNPGKMPISFFPAVAATKCDLAQLWQDVAAYDHSTHLNVCFHQFNQDKWTNFPDMREPSHCDQLYRLLGWDAAE